MSETVESRLTALEDERRVRRLVEEYAIRADLGRFEAFGELFTEDAEIDIAFGSFLPVGAKPEVYKGREGARRFVSGPVAVSLLGNCQHHLSGQLNVSVDGHTAQAYGYGFIIFREPAGLVIKSTSFRHWSFAKGDDGWLISRLAIRPLGAAGLDELFAASSGGTVRS